MRPQRWLLISFTYVLPPKSFAVSTLTTYNDLRSKALQSFKCLLWCSDRSFGAFTSVGSLWAVMNWNPSWFLQLLWPLARKMSEIWLKPCVSRPRAADQDTTSTTHNRSSYTSGVHYVTLMLLASNQSDHLLARKFPMKNHPGTKLLSFFSF